MANSQKFIESKIRRKSPISNTFSFSKDMVRYPETSEILRMFRQESWRRADELHLPSGKEEAWRRTNFRQFDPSQFIFYDQVGNDIPVIKEYSTLVDPYECDGYMQMTSHNAIVNLSEEIRDQGVIFCDLRTAECEYSDVLERIMGKLITGEEDKFAALACALAQNGFLLYVPPDVTVPKPLYCLSWVPDVGVAHFSHGLIYIENGASATFIHELASPYHLEGDTLYSGNLEGFVGEHAKLNFIEVQSLGDHLLNVTHEKIMVVRSGSVEWIYGAIGSRLSKNFLDLDLVGDKSKGRISGIYFPSGRQHLDIDTQQTHLAPNTESDLLFNGVLLNNSRAIWQGMVYVSPEANQSDGYQMNRSLMIHDTARMDSIPGLEILTDDVRCSHGATIGRIDPEQLFYLQTRGISHKTAERLIIEGFFASVLQRIPEIVPLDRFIDIIRKKLLIYY